MNHQPPGLEYGYFFIAKDILPSGGAAGCHGQTRSFEEGSSVGRGQAQAVSEDLIAAGANRPANTLRKRPSPRPEEREGAFPILLNCQSEAYLPAAALAVATKASAAS